MTGRKDDTMLKKLALIVLAVPMLSIASASNSNYEKGQCTCIVRSPSVSPKRPATPPSGK